MAEFDLGNAGEQFKKSENDFEWFLKSMLEGDNKIKKSKEQIENVQKSRSAFAELLDKVAQGRKNALAPENPYTPEITPINPIVNAGVPPTTLPPRPFGVTLPNAPFTTQQEADEDLLRQQVEQIRKRAGALPLLGDKRITQIGGVREPLIEQVPGQLDVFKTTQEILDANEKAQQLGLPKQKGSLTPERSEGLADIIDKDIFGGYGILGRMLGYDRGAVVTKLAEKYGTILPTEKVYNAYMDTLNSSSSGINALGVISKQLSGLADEKDWVSAWGQGIIDWLTGKAKSNTESASYLANIKASVPLLARSLGHTGVLTELDVASVEQGLPQLTDSAELAKAKIANIVALISGKLKAAENNFYSQLKYHGGEMPVEQRRPLGNYKTIDLILGNTPVIPDTKQETKTETKKETKKVLSAVEKQKLIDDLKKIK